MSLPKTNKNFSNDTNTKFLHTLKISKLNQNEYPLLIGTEAQLDDYFNFLTHELRQQYGNNTILLPRNSIVTKNEVSEDWCHQFTKNNDNKIFFFFINAQADHELIEQIIEKTHTDEFKKNNNIKDIYLVFFTNDEQKIATPLKTKINKIKIDYDNNNQNKNKHSPSQLPKQSLALPMTSALEERTDQRVKSQQALARSVFKRESIIPSTSKVQILEQWQHISSNVITSNIEKQLQSFFVSCSQKQEKKHFPLLVGFDKNTINELIKTLTFELENIIIIPIDNSKNKKRKNAYTSKKYKKISSYITNNKDNKQIVFIFHEIDKLIENKNYPLDFFTSISDPKTIAYKFSSANISLENVSFIFTIKNIQNLPSELKPNMHLLINDTIDPVSIVNVPIYNIEQLQQVLLELITYNQKNEFPLEHMCLMINDNQTKKVISKLLEEKILKDIDFFKYDQNSFKLIKIIKNIFNRRKPENINEENNHQVIIFDNINKIIDNSTIIKYPIYTLINDFNENPIFLSLPSTKNRTLIFIIKNNDSSLEKLLASKVKIIKIIDDSNFKIALQTLESMLPKTSITQLLKNYHYHQSTNNFNPICFNANNAISSKRLIASKYAKMLKNISGENIFNFKDDSWQEFKKSVWKIYNTVNMKNKKMILIFNDIDKNNNERKKTIDFLWKILNNDPMDIIIPPCAEKSYDIIYNVIIKKSNLKIITTSFQFAKINNCCLRSLLEEIKVIPSTVTEYVNKLKLEIIPKLIDHNKAHQKITFDTKVIEAIVSVILNTNKNDFSLLEEEVIKNISQIINIANKLTEPLHLKINNFNKYLLSYNNVLFPIEDEETNYWQYKIKTFNFSKFCSQEIINQSLNPECIPGSDNTIVKYINNKLFKFSSNKMHHQAKQYMGNKQLLKLYFNDILTDFGQEQVRALLINLRMKDEMKIFNYGWEEKVFNYNLDTDIIEVSELIQIILRDDTNIDSLMINISNNDSANKNIETDLLKLAQKVINSYDLRTNYNKLYEDIKHCQTEKHTSYTRTSSKNSKREETTSITIGNWENTNKTVMTITKVYEICDEETVTHSYQKTIVHNFGIKNMKIPIPLEYIITCVIETLNQLYQEPFFPNKSFANYKPINIDRTISEKLKINMLCNDVEIINTLLLKYHYPRILLLNEIKQITENLKKLQEVSNSNEIKAIIYILNQKLFNILQTNSKNYPFPQPFYATKNYWYNNWAALYMAEVCLEDNEKDNEISNIYRIQSEIYENIKKNNQNSKDLPQVLKEKFQYKLSSLLFPEYISQKHISNSPQEALEFDDNNTSQQHLNSTAPKAVEIDNDCVWNNSMKEKANDKAIEKATQDYQIKSPETCTVAKVAGFPFLVGAILLL